MAANQIYVGRADAVDLEIDGETVIDLNAALSAAATDATEITILGGYYQAEWLVQLFRNLPARRRRACKVRIAVGSDATVSLPRTFREMQDVRSELRRLGYRDIEVAVVGRSPVHFHTKLFRFLRTTRPSWYVGSANPGSERHELMIRVAGRHPGLSSYVDAVFAVAQPVEHGVPERQSATTIREFLLDGVLCHRPPAQQLFTFDAYRLSPEDRRRIDTRLGEGSGVEHASPRTEGFGFGLRSALALPADEDTDRDGIETRTRFRSLGMDTLFGLWMPRVYAAEAEGSVRQREDARRSRLASIGSVINAEGGHDRVLAAFNAYVASMDRYLGDLGIEARPVRDRDAGHDSGSDGALMSWEKLKPEEVATIAAAVRSRSDTRRTTWQNVIEESTAVTGRKYSRQALEKHKAICDAYEGRVVAHRKFRSTGSKERVVHLDAKDRRIERLERELGEAKAIINAYDARFYLLLANTARLGFRREELERPLPPNRPYEEPPTA
ncbi:hypothetical protein [Sphingomonas sp. 1185]|uniref:hypothetical protein n=1 Tax=Sphingomonas sp. 1185 TaxID=3156411 RepID=UPI00339A81B6